MKTNFLFLFISLIGCLHVVAQINPPKCFAYALYKNKKYQEAIVQVVDSVKDKDFGAYAVSAQSYFELKDYSHALELYLKANQIDSRQFNYQIAFCYARLSNEAKCIEYLRQSILLTGKPLLSDLTLLNSIIKTDLSVLYDAASRQVNEAKEAIENGDYDKAIQILDDPEKGKDQSLLYFYRAMAFYKNGSIKEAQQNLKQAVKKNQDLRSESLFKDICLGTGDSAQYYNFAASQVSDYDLDLILEKINAYLYLKKAENAQALIDQVQSICLQFPSYSRKLIGIYKKNGDYLDALKAINVLIAQNKSDCNLLNQRGILFLDAKLYKEAKHDFSMSLDIDPNQAEAFYNRGTARSALGEKEGADADWNNAKKLGYFKR